ncbi:hypothetical protein PFISCL1PPCAC_14856, partial [Pristionchus fissidentatus]
LSGVLMLLLLFFLPFSSPLNIFHYSSTVAGSHLSFANQLTSLLVDNGHTVDFVVARVNSLVGMKENKARHTVVIDFPNMKSPWNANAGHLKDPFLDTSSSNPFKNTVFNIYTTSKNQLCPFVLDSEEVNELLTTFKYDIAIVSAFDFCPLGLTHKYGIPVTMYSPTPLFHFQVVHSGLPQLPLYENSVVDSPVEVDRYRFIDRLIDFTSAAYGRWQHEQHQQETNSLFRSRFGSSFPSARELARKVSYDFVNTIALMDEPRPISSRIKYIGGIGFPQPKPLSKEIDGILKSAETGNVIFSFGTQVPPNNIRPDIVHNFAAAFKRFPEYNFIWKFDGRTQMNASNIFNLEWLPQTDLLFDSRVVAFISHMGLNSFVESSLAGVPLISIPLMVDQFHNARQAIRLGTSVKLDKTNLSEEKIVKALEEILNHKSYAEKAQKLSEKLRDNPEQSERTLLESIEFAAKYPDLHEHFTLISSDFSFLASHGYDIVIFLTLLSSLFIVSSFLLTISILSNLFRVAKLKKD